MDLRASIVLASDVLLTDGSHSKSGTPGLSEEIECRLYMDDGGKRVEGMALKEVLRDSGGVL